MPWPMSRPPGEDRSQGEGAASSHWASIILLVAVTPCADRISGRRTCLCPGLTFLRTPAYVLSDPVTGTVHAPMQSDAAGPLQCRAPAPQSRRHRGMEPGDVRGVQQSQLPRAQLRAGPVRRGGDQPADGLRDGPESPEGAGAGATARSPG